MIQDAPRDPAQYSHRRCADDIKELAHQLGARKIILGGHDWYVSICFYFSKEQANKYRGAALAYRVALWHPELVTHLFTLCVPFAAPTRRYIPLEEFVATIAPHFAYQLQFRSRELEHAIRTEDDVKKFLSALYGGRTDDGQIAFYAEEGVILENMFRLRPSKLLSEEVRHLTCRQVWLVLTAVGTRLLCTRILPEWSFRSMYVLSTTHHEKTILTKQ